MIVPVPPKKLLVIEDNPGDQRLIRTKLAESFSAWQTELCETLRAALARAPFPEYDCLLVDLGLPDAAGLDAVFRLRTAAPAIALVVLTGLDDEQVAQDAIRAGAQDYVVKSLAGLELLPRVICHAVERQQSQTALDASHRTAQALLDASHDLALLLDAAGRVVTLNAHASEYFGRPAAKLVGADFFSLLPPALAGRRRAAFAEALQSGRTVEFEDGDGSRWFANRLLAVAGAAANDHRCAVFIREITAERAAAAKLAEAKEEADLANRAKTEFMARMSRDIRTPLNDVVGFAEMIASEMLGPIQPARYRDFAEAVNNSGVQILKLIDRITDVSMLETVLLKDQSSYRDLVELSPDLICVCVDGVIERINIAGAGMLRAPAAEACEGRPFLDFVHERSRAAIGGGLDTLYAEEHPVPVQIVTFAGRTRDLELSAVPLTRDGRTATLLVGRDITEVTAAMRAVAAREHRIRAIMDTVLDAIITIDEDGTILNANLSVERIFGYPLSDVIGTGISVLMPDPAGAGEASHPQGCFHRFLRDGDRSGGEVMARRGDGSEFPVHLSVAELALGASRLFTGTIRDLSESKALAQRVAYLANHDPLTDLPNRALLADRLSQTLVQARGRGHHVAVLTVDLDGFTTINDSLGHEAGNQLLCETARRLTHAVSAVGTAARLGGDEFAAVLPQLADLGAVARAVDAIQEVLAKPYHIESTELSVMADIGISVFPRDGDEAHELLRKAEMALHTVKRQPGGRLGFFEAAMSFAVSERLTLERSLQEALKSERFELFYQPQVRLADNYLIGAEALIRWRHPELGIIAPDRFIPLAEETGLIVPIGAWVLRTACAQLKVWADSGLPPLRLGVNISGRQFREPNLAGQVAEAIAEAGIDPGMLDLELTESILMMDGEGALQLLRDLADLGVTLSIDDFGTGYSSLAYLKRFPVHTVKIDRTFIRDLDHDQDGRVIANAIISLAHSLSLKTIAEGVETEAQAKLLARQGCDEIQGYLVGRPMPASEFRAFAASYEVVARDGMQIQHARPPQGARS
ncbi:MAG: EAL domain-containing protein [Magnetospirillum sp.]|nr:EAL domain-containing protein [Magnetospirillum sp.]